MLPILESLVAELLSLFAELRALGPEHLLLIGAHEIRLGKPKRFVHVRSSRGAALVEV